MFNNLSLKNEEIDKILLDYENEIKKASKINGIVDDEVVQAVRIALYRKLSRNRDE